MKTPSDMAPPSWDANASLHGVGVSGVAMFQQLEHQIHTMLRCLMAKQSDGEPADYAGSPSAAAQPRADVAEQPRMPATSGAPADDGRYAALDGYSRSNDQSDLSKWRDLAPPGQEASLERPLSAMQILSGKTGADGQKPTAAQTSAARQFVDDNPSLKSALQNMGALKPDGSIDRKKLGGFLRDVEHNLSLAEGHIKDYMKKHPDADANSLNVARSAGLLQAYDPIAGNATGHKSHGDHNDYGGGKNGGGLTTKQQVADLDKNAGFGAALKDAAQAWSTNGALDALERSGDDKATSKRDGVISARNLTHFIKDDAPASTTASQQFLQDASLQNVTAGTDIGRLNQDIFANPLDYAPQQKAAVMVKLMETLVDVKAGGADKLRKVDATVAALQQDIRTLANDPATQAYLQRTVPPGMQRLGAAFTQAGGVGAGGSGGATVGGQATGGMSGGVPGSDVAERVHEGLQDAKTVTQTLGNLAKGNGVMGLGGNGAAAEAAVEGVEGATAAAQGAAEGVAAGVEGGAAAAEGVMGAVAGGLAATAPVLAVGAGIAGIAGIVMAIVEAVKKHQHQKEFASNVNPTLKQFGIPLPK